MKCSHHFEPVAASLNGGPVMWACKHCGAKAQEQAEPVTAVSSDEIRRQLGPTGREKTR